MAPLDYDFLRQAVKQRSGLALGADNHYFVESRLLPLARQAGLVGVGDLVLALKTSRDPTLMTAVVEAMTINESFFFRDKSRSSISVASSCRHCWLRGGNRGRCVSGVRLRRAVKSPTQSPYV